MWIFLLSFSTLYAQTGQITLRVYWSAEKQDASALAMNIVVNDTVVCQLFHGETKDITLDAGRYTFYAEFPKGKQGDAITSNRITFNADSVFQLIPAIKLFSKNTIDIVNIAPRSSANVPSFSPSEVPAGGNQPRTNSNNSQRASNYGQLPNTTWTSSGSTYLYGNYQQTIDFGNGNYRYVVEFDSLGFPASHEETGTYLVSGDNVIFISDDDETIIANVQGLSPGKQISGRIIGRSLTVGGSTYR